MAGQCLEAGACELLEKPFSSRLLLSTVAHAVERSRLLRTATLYDASRAVFASQDPGAIPQVIVETAASALRADQASLMVPEGPHHLVVAYSKGFPESARGSYVVRIGEGIAGRVAEEGKPVLIVGPASEDPRFRSVRAHGRVHSSIVYPLLAGTRVVGGVRGALRGEEKELSTCDLNDAVRFALRMSALQVSNAEITTSLGDGVQVRGDEARLGQVFLNLLVNAGQALAGRPDARVRVTTERSGDEVRVMIADNGPGIAPADQRRIFDAFFTTKRGESGSGLGLAISREIVSQHGGELTVQSEVGKGSRFIVKLPAAG